MKSVHEALDQILPEIIAMSEDIYCHPELGFKEFRTRKKAIEALDKAGIPHEDVAYTGIRAVLDSGKPGPNIGLITEFDAVPTFGHPYASEDSCAAPYLRPLRSAWRYDELIFSHQGIRYVKGSLRKGHTSRDAGGGVLRYGLPEGTY